MSALPIEEPICIERQKLVLEAAWEMGALSEEIVRLVDAVDGNDGGNSGYIVRALSLRMVLIADVQRSLLDEPSIDTWTLREQMVGEEKAAQERKSGCAWWLGWKELTAT